MSEDERETRKRLRTVVLTVAAAAPPAVTHLVEAATGTHLGPLPAAFVEVSTVGLAISATLAAQRDAWHTEDERQRRRQRAAARRRIAERERLTAERQTAEYRHVVEPPAQRVKEQPPPTKSPGYERELWERGRIDPERNLEPGPD